MGVLSLGLLLFVILVATLTIVRAIANIVYIPSHTQFLIMEKDIN